MVIVTKHSLVSIFNYVGLGKAIDVFTFRYKLCPVSITLLIELQSLNVVVTLNKSSKSKVSFNLSGDLLFTYLM